jgi:hypothetical protein
VTWDDTLTSVKEDAPLKGKPQVHLKFSGVYVILWVEWQPELAWLALYAFTDVGHSCLLMWFVSARGSLGCKVVILREIWIHCGAVVSKLLVSATECVELAAGFGPARSNVL